MWETNIYNEEIVVTMQENTIDNFSSFSDDELKILASELEKEYVNYGISVTDYQIYHHPQTKFIKIDFKDIKFDLLISGVNDGFNISYDTLYSGTIGACIQATLNHLPSIAISCDGNFELVEEHLEKTFEYVINNYFPKGEYLINVNFPMGNEIKGHKLSKLYLRNDKHWIIQNGNEIRFQRELDNDITLDDSDWYLVNNGYVSITPLKASYFNDEGYNLYKK